MRINTLHLSLNNLANRKLRSWLTILSILIGITAIFALSSFGLGILSYIDTLAQEEGVDKLFIQAKGVGAPGTDDNFFLTKNDIDFIGKIKGIKEAAGIYMKAGELKFNGETKYNFVAGWDTRKNDFVEDSFGGGIFKGRALKEGDKGKVLLGYNYQFQNKIFKKPLKIGDKLDINGERFEVVGFFDSIGNPQDDANVYMTDETMESLFDTKDKFGFVMAMAEKNEDPRELAERVQEKLRKHKGQEEGKEDFFVQTFADAIQTFTSIIGVITGVLFLIALISMLVASVNIMNTMYTSILERTKEIGVMKAIGAQNKNILLIFVMESGLLGAVGGVLGVVLGYLIASAGGLIAANAGFSALQPIFPVYLVFGCVFFAFFVGALSGLLPAVRASKLNPVDALRYE